MSLAQVTSGLESGLVSSLDFSLSKTADYIIQRNAVQYLPTAGNSWSPNAQRTIEFRMSGSSFIDVSTLLFSCEFVNEGGTAITTTCPLHGIFSRISTTIGGQVVENIDHAGRVSELIYRLMPPQAKVKYCDQSFPLVLKPKVFSTTAGTLTDVDHEQGLLEYEPIPQGASHCMMPFWALGMFHGQKLMLPLQFLSSMVITMPVQVAFVSMLGKFGLPSSSSSE